MYAYISGKLGQIADGYVVVDNNGIGYKLNCSNNTIVKCGAAGSDVNLHTYLMVKEDDMSLYGFYSAEEKHMFEKLIGISGVGPKLAIQVLSGCDLRTLAISIANSDVSAITRIKGVGKKTAERIILELREKVDADSVATDGVSVIGDSAVNDAVMALVSLGYSKTEAYKCVAKAREKTADVNGLITLALRSMDK